MNELVACLAQNQESILGEVVVVRCVHVMYVQVAQTFVLDTAVLAGHVPRCRKEPPE